ncbi:hypothetical protein KW790_01765 [Candidatus Parcubacteria bacterium]|nr:hypothetical protein [Candidatus Parcubacteria bacterium]
MTLRNLVLHFFSMYGRRNDLFLPDVRTRLDLLNFGIADWQDAIRKHRENRQVLNVAAARVVSRIFCVNHAYPTVVLDISLAKKFGRGCGYCKHIPCICQGDRRESLTTSSTQREYWSLGDWSSHLGALYGEANRRAGVENVLNRLQSEFSEFARLVAETQTGRFEIDELEMELGLELADMLAWTIGLAGVLDIDLEGAVRHYYGKGCLACQSPSCRCSKHFVRQVDWSRWLLTRGEEAASGYVR